MLIDAPRSQLLIIDLQARLVPAIADHELVVAGVLWLVRAAQKIGVPVAAPVQATPAALDPALYEQGRQVYLSQYCGVCHSLATAGTRGAFDPVFQALAARQRVDDQRGGSDEHGRDGEGRGKGTRARHGDLPGE